MRSSPTTPVPSLPTAIHLLAFGDNESTQGMIRVTETTLRKLPRNQLKRGFERVAIDWNHSTISTAREYGDLLSAGQPPIIFGYGRVGVDRRSGLYLDQVVWTPAGERDARNFRALSPAVETKASGEVEFLHSVALTTNGSLYGARLDGKNFTLAARAAARPGGTNVYPGDHMHRLCILNWGAQRGDQGAVIVNDGTAELLRQNRHFLQGGRVPIVLAAGLQGRDPALAGHGTVEVHRGAGLFLEDIDWEPRAVESVARCSGLIPGLILGDGGLVAGLTSVVLCGERGRQGFRPLPRCLLEAARRGSRL